MKKNHYHLLILFIMILLYVFAVGGFAHPGRTDANGGHYNRKTGEYHYHHGYPAHQHPNGVCPYNYVDLTGQNSGSRSGNSSSGSSSSSSAAYKKKLAEKKKKQQFEEAKKKQREKDIKEGNAAGETAGKSAGKRQGEADGSENSAYALPTAYAALYEDDSDYKSGSADYQSAYQKAFESAYQSAYASAYDESHAIWLDRQDGAHAGELAGALAGQKSGYAAGINNEEAAMPDDYEVLYQDDTDYQNASIYYQSAFQTNFESAYQNAYNAAYDEAYTIWKDKHDKSVKTATFCSLTVVAIILCIVLALYLRKKRLHKKHPSS